MTDEERSYRSRRLAEIGWPVLPYHKLSEDPNVVRLTPNHESMLILEYGCEALYNYYVDTEINVRCQSRAPSVRSGTLDFHDQCVERAGHAGPHRDGHGVAWLR